MFASRFLAVCVALGATALSAAPSAAANLLSNGSFEAAPPPAIGFRSTAAAPSGEVQDYFGNRITSQQFVAGWTLDDPVNANLIHAPYKYSLAPNSATDGVQFLHLNWSPLGGVILNNTIRQSITLSQASTLDFSTMMAVENGFAGSTLQVSLLDGNGAVVAQSGLFTHLGGNQTWSKKSWSTGTTLAAGTYVLALNGIGNDNAWDVLLDDVQLSANAVQPVPEPATWAMMIGGFAFAGATLRRRQAKLAFA